jgi:signal transduction histidine kinase
VLSVRDDGRGTTPEALASTGRLGLVGMRERAALLSGEVQIDSAPGEGTTVTARIPLAGPAPSE